MVKMIYLLSDHPVSVEPAVLMPSMTLWVRRQNVYFVLAGGFVCCKRICFCSGSYAQKDELEAQGPCVVPLSLGRAEGQKTGQKIYFLRPEKSVVLAGGK
jgi:hypothetical protein